MRRRFLGAAMAVLMLGAAGCGKFGDKVEEQIETVGTELTGEEVAVEAVDLRALRAAGQIRASPWTIPRSSPPTSSFRWTSCG